MPQRRVVVTAESGLHARPAGVFTRAATETGLAILVGRPGQELVDARSILAVMSLGITQGEEIVISSDDPGSHGALDVLVKTVTQLDQAGELA